MSGWDDATIDWYAEHHGEDPTVFALVERVDIGPHDDVLDIGCGTGSALRALAARTDGRLVGVDPFARMIAHAHAATEAAGLADRIAFAVAPAESLPLNAARFNVVLAINAVHHWQDLSLGFAEAARVLRPGGTLALGGERFGESALPLGQEYSDALHAAGLQPKPPQDFPGGFIQLAGKLPA